MSNDNEWKSRIREIQDHIEMLEAILEADNDGYLGGDPYYHDLLMTLMMQVKVMLALHKAKLEKTTDG